MGRAINATTRHSAAASLLDMGKYLDCRVMLAFSFLSFAFLSGCGGRSSSVSAPPITAAPTPTPAPQATPQDYAVYASTYPDDFLPSGIFAYRVSGSTGIATPIAGLPFAAPHGIAKLMVSRNNNVLFANSFDSIDFSTDQFGADRGMYTFQIATDGTLSAPVRLNQTYFPATLSPSGSFLYRAESSDESFGSPLSLTAYTVNQSSGTLSPQTIAPVTVSGQEIFDGELVTDPTGFWVKTGNPVSNVHTFEHFQIQNQTGAVSDPQHEAIIGVDMYSTMVAASVNYLVALDGTARVQNTLHFWTIQNSSITAEFILTGCGLSFCPDEGTTVAINPTQTFAFVLNHDSILTVPLSLSAGPDFDHARSTPLPASHFFNGGTFALSPDGKVLALGRFGELDIFMVAADGSLTPAVGSPFQTSLTAPPVVAIAGLPLQ